MLFYSKFPPVFISSTVNHLHNHLNSNRVHSRLKEKVILKRGCCRDQKMILILCLGEEIPEKGQSLVVMDRVRGLLYLPMLRPLSENGDRLDSGDSRVQQGGVLAMLSGCKLVSSPCRHV